MRKNRDIYYLYYLLSREDKFYTYEKIKKINNLISKLIRLLED